MKINLGPVGIEPAFPRHERGVLPLNYGPYLFNLLSMSKNKLNKKLGPNRIELWPSAYQADVLPLNYGPKLNGLNNYNQTIKILIP